MDNNGFWRDVPPIDLTDLRDALLKEYPLDKYPPEEGE